jgi:glycosyltransferase involved in cell wall biosynthesis
MFIRDQALALGRLGLDVVVLHVSLRSPRSLSGSSAWGARPHVEARLDETPPVYRWRAWSLGAASVPALMRRGARRLLRELEGAPRRTDVVHAHFSFGGGDAASVIAEALDAPMVITEHSSEFARGLVVGRRRDAILDSLDRADALIVVSPALAEDVRRVTGRASTMIPNVVDVDSFPARTRRPGGTDRFEIVTVGSLQHKKGYDLLVRALADLPSDDWRTTIVGDGRERNRLRTLADELGLASRIEFSGVLSRDRIMQALMDADVFVSSSRQETFGVAVAEALSVGVPVVVTPGGAASFVEPPYGLVVPAEPAAISAGIDRVMRGECAFDPALSHARMAQVFGAESVAERIRTVYREVISLGQR